MTVEELIEQLSGFPGDAEVRLATQPSYPLAFSVRGVTGQADVDIDAAYDKAEQGGPLVDEDEIREHCEPIVWIAEGGSTGYAPRGAWEV
jgi:hypothetical protein